MNTISSLTTVAPIQLNATFLRLANGAARMQDIVRERCMERAVQLAGEDDYSRRRRERDELNEAFQASLGYRDLLTPQ
jgi:hypothetical protein